MFFLDNLTSNTPISGIDPENICNTTSDIYMVFVVAVWIVRVIQFAVPFALIIWGSLDFFKAVIAGDEKEMKAKRKPFMHRIIAAVVVLILPTLVNMIISTFKDENQFTSCWNAARTGQVDFMKFDD